MAKDRDWRACGDDWQMRSNRASNVPRTPRRDQGARLGVLHGLPERHAPRPKDLCPGRPLVEDARRAAGALTVFADGDEGVAGKLHGGRTDPGSEATSRGQGPDGGSTGGQGAEAGLDKGY